MSSVISSLYGSPSPSMMSRDPTGVDPNGMDDTVSHYQLEPTGSRADETAEPEVPPGLLDVAMLVGAPPPPPTAPPPKKPRRRTNTPHHGKAGTTPKSSGHAYSFDDEAFQMPQGFTPLSPTENGEKTLHTRNIVISDSADSVKIDSPPRKAVIEEEDNDKTNAIVDQRLKAAMAIYESEDLVLDTEATTSNNVQRPVMATLENKQQTPTSAASPLSVKSNPAFPANKTAYSPRYPASPSSEVTRPHSNKTSEVYKSTSGSMSVLSNIKESSPREDVSSPTAVSSSSEEVPTEQPTRRGRGFSLERKTKKAQGNKEEKQKRDQKRGFFKKLFRGRSKTRGTSPKAEERLPPSRRANPSPGSASSAKSEAREPVSIEPEESGLKQPEKPPTPRQSPAIKPSLKSSEEHQHQGPPTNVETGDDKEVVQNKSLPFDESPRQQPSPMMSAADSATPVAAALFPNEASQAAPVNPQFFSQDPPDDEHGDPPVFSGRPLLSPTSLKKLHVDAADEENSEEEQSRIDSVKSRIAGLYEEHALSREVEDEHQHGPITEVPSNLSNDQQDFFFANDEVSALSGSKVFDTSTVDDKSESLLESPVPPPPPPPPPTESHKKVTAPYMPDSQTVDPYNTQKQRQSNGAPLPTPTRESELRVQVQQAPSMDPAGASPMKWDHRGLPVRNAGFRDPKGESPLHATQNTEADADDPPLTAGFVDDDSSVGGADLEKREDDPEIRNPSASKATTHAALELAKTTRTKVVKEQSESNPTPKNSDTSVERAGSTPIKSEIETTLPATAKLEAAIPPRSKNLQKAKLKVKTSAETDVAKSGFKSASSTPMAGDKKQLTIATAAFTNAKAVAYFHRLHGEPSPRHSWHASKAKKPEPSPLAARARRNRNKKNEKSEAAAPGSSKKPSPADYGAHNFDPSKVSEELVSEEQVATPSNSAVTVKKPPSPEELLHTLKIKEGTMFSAYKSKFQGRKPTKKKALKPETPSEDRASKESQYKGPMLRTPRGTVKPISFEHIVLKPGKITGMAVAKGIKLRRSKRDDDVASGKSERVVLTPRVQTEGRNRFKFFPAKEEEIKDPIQRAGRRLLSKSAIPIQCAIRRYLANRKAIDRMWALIEIQSYFRRWRCEANLQASIHSAVVIQTYFRGWLSRDKVKEMQYCATQIQKVVRSYLAQAQVYDTMYYVVRIQALLKGCCERKMLQRKQEAAVEVQRLARAIQARHQLHCRKKAVLIQAVYRGHLGRELCAVARQMQIEENSSVPIQAVYRGHKARQEYSVAIASVLTIQSEWRSYSSRISYQFEIVDIIIAQSIVRRWTAYQQVQRLKDEEFFGPVSLIQAAWRGHVARQAYHKERAVLKIQATWRGFRCYTDYIFALVDVLVVQRTARQWLARRAVQGMRQENASVKIQAAWRSCQAQKTLLYSLVHIIIAQGVARRYLSRFAVQKRKAMVEVVETEAKERRAAAVVIQKAWRGFWGFSHYIIIQYELTRLQAVVRGKLARQTYNLKLGCAIIVQATMRRHLAKNTIERKVAQKALFEADVLALRERNAAKKIQFWWRIVLDWTNEKKAALTIERFFLHVRGEVDREIIRREQRKLIKKEQRRKKRRESDEKMVEKAWLNTVDENTAAGYSKDSQSETGSRRANPEQPHRTPALGANRRLLSPKQSSIGQEVDIDGWPIQRVDSVDSHLRPPTDAVQMAASEDHSEVSNITNPTYFNRHSSDRHSMQSRQTKDRRMSTEDYIKRYGSAAGPRTAPNRSTPNNAQHFFSDEASAGSKKQSGTPRTQTNTPRSATGTPTSRRRSSSGTPKSQSHEYGPSTGFGHSSQPVHPSTASRSSYGTLTTPRSQASSHQLTSPRITVGYPPVTPRGGMSKHQPISRGETAETESQTTFSQASYSKASPRARSEKHIVKDGRSVVVMKNHSNFSRSHSIEEAQEVMYLDGVDLGQEYGEV